MKIEIIFIIIIGSLIFILLTLLLISFKINKNKPKSNSSLKCLYPESNQNDFNMRNWKWVDKCKDKTNFIIESEWPTFLTYEAWNSCQGCKSAGDGTDSSGDSFQVIGDWMRLSQRNGNDVSIVSGASSKKHWFNPPRNNTDDKPLEIEWYMYLDASNWGNTPEELMNTNLTDKNWSAFWAFGHGRDKFGWPNGGEWDIAEWLPTFGGKKAGKGLASGFHNGNSGAFPPCCIQRDDIMFPNSGTIYAQQSKNSKYLWPGYNAKDLTPEQIKSASFRTWGYSLVKGKYGNDANGNDGYYKSDAYTYNTLFHCFLRCTTKQVTIWAKTNCDPKNPPNIKTNPSMSNDEVGKLFIEQGYVPVFNSYADFGSNYDTTYADAFPNQVGQEATANAPTNWHQNMFFVWAVILSHNGSRLTKERDSDDFDKPLTFYLSDIRLRGGGNYKKAMPPPGVIDTKYIKMATEESDPSAFDACAWIGKKTKGYKTDNPAYMCTNRLSQDAFDQYKKCNP